MQYPHVVTVLLCFLSANEALRILVLFPVHSKSHSLLGHGMVDRLLQAGHEVVHFTSFPRTKHNFNLTEYNVSSIGSSIRKQSQKVGAFELRNLIQKGNVVDSISFSYFTYVLHRDFLEHPSVIEFLNDPKERFDLVINEWFFAESLAGVAPLFQCAMIWVCSTEPHWQALRLIDEAPNTAYTVDMFATSRAPLNFWERTFELWKVVKKSVILMVVTTFEKLLYYRVYPEIAARRGIKMPSYEEAVYNGSLMFINSHPSVGSAFRLPQNAINIAGYHINDKLQPLSKDLQKLMDQGEHGVIYFSMGSNVKSSGMSQNMKEMLLRIFGSLNQTVLWKFESNLESVPANVHLLDWAPQQTILAHPNLKFFITHGGQLSTTEALYYGIPLIGVPIMADQHMNMVTVERKGFGVKVKLSEDMEDELAAAIKEMLTNNSYKLRAQELSTIYHDRIATPGEEILHWVQHVVKTKGAPHLRSPALHVPLYQKLYLDLAAALLVAAVTLHKVLPLILKKIKLMQKLKEKIN